MLTIRPTCENCNRDLPAHSAQAMICSFECTFCCDCVENVLANVCPNCGGGFERRPVRPRNEWRKGISLDSAPASTEVVLEPVDEQKHQAFAGPIKDIDPSQR
jgi:hypothetical protein